MKRVLTSLCGVLLVVSFALMSATLEMADFGKNDTTSFEIFIKGTVLSLNIIFLLAFLASILATIKEEDKNEKQNHSLL